MDRYMGTCTLLKKNQIFFAFVFYLAEQKYL